MEFSNNGVIMSSKRLVSREPDQMREVTMQRNINKHAEGSVLVGFGDTKVICTGSRDTSRFVLIITPLFENSIILADRNR
jgi:hypothetical protein